MLDVIEDVRNEFKIKLTDKFEEEVISFLNTNGGNIYIGGAVFVHGNVACVAGAVYGRADDSARQGIFGGRLMR